MADNLGIIPYFVSNFNAIQRFPFSQGDHDGTIKKGLEYINRGRIRGMKSWKAVIAAVLLTVTAFCALATVAGGMIYAVWTRPGFYDRVLTREEAYPEMTNLLLDWMEEGLPHGREASRYLRTSLTPEWVQAHAGDILTEVSGFVRGRTEEKPRIDVADLKELLYETLPRDKTQQQRREEAWLMLSPLPDSAVWSDFLSPEPLYAARDAIGMLRNVLLILSGCLLVSLGLWWALERRIGKAFHWLGGALTAGGLLGLLFCAAAWLLIPRLLVFWQIEQGLITWGMADAIAGGLLKGFINYAALGLGTACAGTALIGYLLMQIPVSTGEDEDRPNLKLIKPDPANKSFLKYPL